MTYLTKSQYKLNKSLARGWKTAGLNLSPDIEARLVLKDKTLPTMCAASGTCAKVCLVNTGMNKFPQHARVRAQKTQEWVRDPQTFIAKVNKEILSAANAAKKSGHKFAVRPNLLSDQPRLAHFLAKANPTIQFYDYTKLARPRTRVLDNYHLTYSFSERTTRQDLLHCLQYGINIAVVMSIRRDGILPKSVKVMGKWLPVIDGDKDDLRFLDKEGAVVALRWKGSKLAMAAGVAGGFVVDPKKELVR